MLILNRKVGETVVIGNLIYAEVLEVRGSTVKLGFVAPTHVRIHRKEISERQKQERAAAALRGGEVDE